MKGRKLIRLMLTVMCFAQCVYGSTADAGDITLKLPPTLGYFSYDPGRGEDRIAIGFGPLGDNDRERGEWFMMGKAPSGTRPTKLRWATTKTCPTARDLIPSLRRFEMPQAVAPSDRLPERHPGGPVYILETQVAFAGRGSGEIRLVSGERTPLASWINNAFATLANCWEDQGPFNEREED